MKAACVGWSDPAGMPEWVAREISAAGIDFVYRQCESPAEVVELAADAEVVWVMGSQVGGNWVTEEILPQLEKCVAIIRSGSGTDNVPVRAATDRGITVCNTPDATAVTVAEHACALLMALARELPAQDRLVRSGGWNSYDPMPRFQLRGRTLGLVGFGRIARNVASRMAAFGVRIVAYDPMVPAAEVAAAGAEPRALPELLAESDFISLHVPLLDATRHLIGAAELEQMKGSAVLINTARGGLVDTAALADALRSGKIGAAGLDVLESEPPSEDDPCVGLPNALITSHMAGHYAGFHQDFWRLSVETLIDLSEGRAPRSVVNPGVKARVPLAPRG